MSFDPQMYTYEELVLLDNMITDCGEDYCYTYVCALRCVSVTDMASFASPLYSKKMSSSMDIWSFIHRRISPEFELPTWSREAYFLFGVALFGKLTDLPPLMSHAHILPVIRWRFQLGR